MSILKHFFTVIFPSYLQHARGPYTAQKMKFSIKYFFSKYDQMKKSLKKTFVFCAVLHLEELQ